LNETFHIYFDLNCLISLYDSNKLAKNQLPTYYPYSLYCMVLINFKFNWTIKPGF
jgi:hypothetical protein